MSCQNFASTSEGTLAYGVQSACGVTQTVLKTCRFASESLNMTAESASSNEIRANRTKSKPIRTSTSVGGDINVEFSYEVFDDFLQGLLQSATPLDGANTEIKNGVTKKYFTIERNTPNAAGTNYYTQFTDMQVSGMTMNIAQGAFVEGSFSFLGQANPVESGTSLDTVGGYTAAPNFPVYNTLANVSAVLVDGTPVGSVESVSFTVTNNMREQRAIGSIAPAGVGNGDFQVTGDISIYFENTTLYNKFITDTSFALVITLDDETGATNGNQYTFRMPVVTLTNATRNITGNNQDVLVQASFEASVGASDTVLAIKSLDAAP